jgi:hypothetical protein
MKLQAEEELTQDHIARMFEIFTAYKIHNLKDMPDGIQKLGAFTVNESRVFLPKEKIPNEVILQGLIKCVRSGYLEMHYLVECPRCSTLNQISEPSIDRPSALSDIKNGIIKCSYCDNAVSSSDKVKSIDMVFTIAERYQTDIYKASLLKAPDELDWNESYLSRILRWLKLKR